MKIKSAEYAGTFVDTASLPPEPVPEVAVVGRSNVGKSSLINRSLNRKNLAKSSSTPGKTRTINLYRINNAFYIADLPGYGYARAAKTERARWARMIEHYLRHREQLRGVIMLVDIRHPPSENDLLMKGWLEENHIPYMVVATKADKISRGRRKAHLDGVRRGLGLPADLELIPFSAESGEGVQELWEAIAEAVSGGATGTETPRAQD